MTVSSVGAHPDAETVELAARDELARAVESFGHLVADAETTSGSANEALTVELYRSWYARTHGPDSIEHTREPPPLSLARAAHPACPTPYLLIPVFFFDEPNAESHFWVGL